MNTQRLRALVEAGDRDAALRLAAEARRREDTRLAIFCASALDDVDALVEHAVQGWKTESWALTTDAGRALGIRLDEDACTKLESVIEAAHGRRRVRLLDRTQVLHTVAMARLRRGHATCHAGDPPSGGSSTVALAVFRHRDQRIVLGVARSRGPSPADVPDWAGALGDWSSGDPGTSSQRGGRSIHDRVQAWASSGAGPNRVELDTTPASVDIIEGEPSVGPVERRLRQLAAIEPDAAVFDALVELVSDWREPSTKSDIVESAREVLADYPDARREVVRPPKLPSSRPKPLHPLQTHLQLRSPMDAPTVAAMRGIEHVHSLEIVEHNPRHAGHDARNLREVLRNTPLGRVRRLVLRVRSPRLIKVVTRSDLPEHVRDLVVRCVDRIDLETAKIHAALYDACSRLQRFELVHRSRFDQLVPALKRVRGAHTVALGFGRIGFARLEMLFGNLRRTRIRHLSLAGSTLKPGTLGVLSRAPVFARLKSLDLQRCQLSARDVAGLAEARFASTLRRLDLSGNTLDRPDGLHALHSLEGIRTLLLESASLTDEALAAVVDDAPWQLKTLDLRRNSLGPMAVDTLAHTNASRRLETLLLGANRLGGRGSRRVLEAAFARHLRTLDLRRAGVRDTASDTNGSEDWTEILRSAQLENLEHLDLGRCNLDHDAVEALVRNPHLKLRTLRLDGNALGPDGIRALADWPGLADLRRLDLTRTGGGKAGRRALADSPWLDALVAGVEGVGATLPWPRSSGVGSVGSTELA